MTEAWRCIRTQTETPPPPPPLAAASESPPPAPPAASSQSTENDWDVCENTAGALDASIAALLQAQSQRATPTKEKSRAKKQGHKEASFSEWSGPCFPAVWLRSEPEPWDSAQGDLSDEAIAARLEAFLSRDEDEEAASVLRSAMEQSQSRDTTASKDEDAYESTPAAMRSLLRFQVRPALSCFRYFHKPHNPP